MNWQPLINIEKTAIGRGYVFRFPAGYPFGDIVDFMVIEEHDAPIGLKLICSTGYHAGQTELILPAESGEKCALSTKWLIENWQKWVFPNCKVDSVKYIECYAANT